MIVTNQDRGIFCLQGLPEEVIAVLFAYYSRSEKGLREILSNDADFKDHGSQNLGSLAWEKKASDFHKKWVVGYGHSSVAEHAILHYGIEGCSILASKAIEDCRLASYTEKSTRYVKFDSFFVPEELKKSNLYDEYCVLMSDAMIVYSKVYEAAKVYIKEAIPRAGEENERIYNNRVHAGACDVARYCLPLSLKTNIGCTINARSAQGMIGKLANHQLLECRDIAAGLFEEGVKICPTLLSQPIVASDFGWSDKQAEDTSANSRWFQDSYDEVTAIRKIVVARLYTQSQSGLGGILKIVNDMGLEELRKAIGHPDRSWEAVDFNYEVTCDYGAFRDIQRHRMMTQFVKLVTPYKGYMIPELLVPLGLVEEYEALCKSCGSFYDKIVEGGISATVAQYALLLGFRVSFLLKMNLREAAHFISLRSRKQGHISYREVAWNLWDILFKEWPDIAVRIPCDKTRVQLARKGTETIERKE